MHSSIFPFLLPVLGWDFCKLSMICVLMCAFSEIRNKQTKKKIIKTRILKMSW